MTSKWQHYALPKDLLEKESLKPALGKLEKYDRSESNEGHILKPTGFGPKYSKTELKEIDGLKTGLGELDEYCVLDGPITDHKNRRFIHAYEEAPIIIRKTSAAYEIERPLTDFVFVVEETPVKAGKSPYRPLEAVMKTIQSHR